MNDLTPGSHYKVIREFRDYDAGVHPIGEEWMFEKSDFVPHHDGLTLHVILKGRKEVFRFQWIPEEQGPLLDNFMAYVEEIKVNAGRPVG